MDAMKARRGSGWRRERAFSLSGRPGWRLGGQRQLADGDAAGQVR